MLAAALSLTVILTFAGMLRQVLGLNEHDACGGGLDAGAIRLCRLSVQTERGAADQTCKCGGQKRAIVPSSSWNMPFIG